MNKTPEVRPQSSFLLDYGIDILKMDDDFNSHLFAAMERYAEAYHAQFTPPPAPEQTEQGNMPFANSLQLEFNKLNDIRVLLLMHPDGEMIERSCLHFLGDEAQRWWENKAQQPPLPEQPIPAVPVAEGQEVYIEVPVSSGRFPDGEGKCFAIDIHGVEDHHYKDFIKRHPERFKFWLEPVTIPLPVGGEATKKPL